MNKTEEKMRGKIGYLNTKEQNNKQVKKEDAAYYEQFPEEGEGEMIDFRETWKCACGSGKMGEIMDEFGKKQKEREKEKRNKK